MSENVNHSKQPNELNALMCMIQYVIVECMNRGMNYRIQKEADISILSFWFVKEGIDVRYNVAVDQLARCMDIGPYLSGCQAVMDNLEDKIRRYKTYNPK